MTTQGTQRVFDLTAPKYNHARAKLIPCYEAFYKAVVDLIPLSSTRLLDLGAGTGLLSAFVRRRFPEVHLCLMDSAERMLAQAALHFEGDPHVMLQLADYTIAPLGGPYNAVISALSIHHLEDAAKRNLFCRIHASIAPGGLFLNAEQILAPTPALETEARTHWLNEVRLLGATEEEIAASLLRQTEDRSATISDQLQWLRDAGFSGVFCSFEQGRFAVLCGRREA